jgi:hypothetical protein
MESNVARGTVRTDTSSACACSSSDRIPCVTFGEDTISTSETRPARSASVTARRPEITWALEAALDERRLLARSRSRLMR